MKKFLLLTGMILAMGAFQSLKAQTFSRVVTVTLDTTVSNQLGLNKVIYTTPPNKIFKLSYIFIDSKYCNTSNCYTLPAEFTVNSLSLKTPSNSGQEEFWLKAGDNLGLKGIISGYNGQTSYNYKIFLSGIEYDVP